MQKCNPKVQSLVESAEVIENSKNYRTIADMVIANEIAEVFYTENKDTLLKRDVKFYQMCLFAAIWNGGRIQGIREERQRRKPS